MWNLNLWFLGHLKDKKIKKIQETIHDINVLNAEMPVVASKIKGLEQSDVRFNRQGKFRYWFKEIHRVSTKPNNQLVLEQLWSKAIQLTESHVQVLNSKYASSMKSCINSSGNFLGLLRSGSIDLCYNPIFNGNLDFIQHLPYRYRVLDFSWSQYCQSTAAMITSKHEILQANVFSCDIIYATCSPKSLCCVKSSKYNPDQIITSGQNLMLWDSRQESPALVSHDLPTTCNHSRKNAPKSSCFDERDDFSYILADKEGQVHVLDKRKPSESVAVHDSKFKDIFSVEINQFRENFILQSASGITKLCNIHNLETMESGYSLEGRPYPVHGKMAGDDYFIHTSDKLYLYNEIFRLPVLSVDLPVASKLLSCFYCEESQKLFCSGTSNALLISFQ